MFDFDSIIGLEEDEARKLLQKAGYNNIKVIYNDKNNLKCDTQIVCRASLDGECVTLVCGNFLTQLKEI